MVASLYTHIPLCTHKCSYCHFYVVPDKESYRALVSEGLKKEWESYASSFDQRKLSSVYFGGGTPSLFGPDRIRDLVTLLPCKDAEITLEANPENLSRQLIEEYASAGINRLSIGVQSLDNQQLSLLTRTHSANKAIDAVKDAYAAGIPNISIDLMYDIPGQTLESWCKTLKSAVQLPIKHISLYNLTIEPHTVFFKHKKELQKTLPSDETSAQMYRMAVEILTTHGFEQYEISAFSKPGFHSVHNSGYWTDREFIGLGPSAFSYWNGKRFRNIARLHQWHNRVMSGLSATDYSESLSPGALQREKLAIRLRLMKGAELDQFHLDEETLQAIDRLKASGLLLEKNGYLKPTEKGILFYDTVASEII